MSWPSTSNVQILDATLLSNNWYHLHKYTFRFRRRDGEWETLTREAYDRGNGAVILLYSKAKNTVVLTRQFRLPAFVNGHADGYLIEACAGLLDGQQPAECIKREVEEETGFRLSDVRKVFEAFMSPGSVTEILYFFVAEYEDSQRVDAGGGIEDEGEEIEVIEVTLPQAMAMVGSGEIQDGKTIMLLQYVALQGELCR